MSSSQTWKPATTVGLDGGNPIFCNISRGEELLLISIR